MIASLQRTDRPVVFLFRDERQCFITMRPRDRRVCRMSYFSAAANKEDDQDASLAESKVDQRIFRGVGRLAFRLRSKARGRLRPPILRALTSPRRPMSTPSR